jgi:hypothetical protein
MMCYFCSRKLELLTTSRWKCPVCPHGVYAFRDINEAPSVTIGSREVPYTYFYYEHKDKEYQFFYYLLKRQFFVNSIDSSRRIITRIITLNYLPRITPYNVETKLPTLLAFL